MARQVPFYISGQIVAAVLASLSLRFMLGPIAALGATRPAGTQSQALVMEAFLTFFLMFVITAVATDSRAVGAMAGWASGGMVALEAIFAGPALASLELAPVWIFLLGPAIGAMAGAWTYRFIRCGGEEHSAGGCC
jgi:aquaporin NIP